MARTGAGFAATENEQSVLRLLVGFRRRRVNGTRRRGAVREVWFGLGVACRRRRPRTIDAFWLDRIDRKPVTGSPQRHRTLSSKTILPDHRGWT